MRALLRRLLQLTIVLLLVTIFTALLIDLVPGDVTNTLAPVSTPEQRDELKHELKLDRPVYERYGEWVGGLVQGDLGCYYGTSGYTTAAECPDKVADKIKDALPISLLLMFYAQVLSLVIAIPLGVATAYRAGSLFDKSVNTIAFGLLAIPNFVLALVLAYYVGVKLGWTDPTSADYAHRPRTRIEHFRAMALPVISLAAGQIAVYMRLLRSDMIATLQEDFVTMAQAPRACRQRRILWRHALRPSSLTLLTVAGLNVGTLIGGAVVIERLFALPGMGTADRRRDPPTPVRRDAELRCDPRLGYVLLNFLVDILYAVLDPRIRHARAVG